MEFDFIHAKGKIQVKLEAGFELMATWIEQELLSTPLRISEFKAVITALDSGLISSWQINTSEHLIELDADELQLNSHSLLASSHQGFIPSASISDLTCSHYEEEHWDEQCSDTEFDGFATELESTGCGTADFYKMLLALEDFCTTEIVSSR